MSQEMINSLMKRIKGEATDDMLFEASGLTEILVSVGDKVALRGKGGDVYTVQEVDEEAGKYLVTDNDGIEEWIEPGQIEKTIDAEPELERCVAKTKKRKKMGRKEPEAAEEGKVPNPKASTTQKIKDLREEDNPVVADEPNPEDAVKPGEENADAPEPSEAPAPAQEEPNADMQDKPMASAIPSNDGEGSINDLVDNMAAAMEHFEKGNYKVAEELLRLVQGTMKTFKDEIKAKKDAEKAAEAPRPEPGEGTDDKKKSVKESDGINIHNYDSSAEVPKEEQTWDTTTLQQDFEVKSFAAPFVMVKRKADGKTGTLEFKHSPRVYFNFVAESKISEQDYTALARGISDEEVAKRIAAEKKGIVVRDETDEKKFMVIMKETYSKEEVEALVLKEKEGVVAETKKKSIKEKEEADKTHKIELAEKEEARKQERVQEEIDMMLSVLAKGTGTPIEDVKEAFEKGKAAYIKEHALEAKDLNGERLRTILEQVINSYKIDQKETLVESLGDLFKFKIQSLSLDEKKSELIDKLLKHKENE